jgi:hypothetical protein
MRIKKTLFLLLLPPPLSFSSFLPLFPFFTGRFFSFWSARGASPSTSDTCSCGMPGMSYFSPRLLRMNSSAEAEVKNSLRMYHGLTTFPPQASARGLLVRNQDEQPDDGPEGEAEGPGGGTPKGTRASPCRATSGIPQLINSSPPPSHLGWSSKKSISDWESRWVTREEGHGISFRLSRRKRTAGSEQLQELYAS